MQTLAHKLTITIPQKFFIEKSIELLYRGTIDSYRVRVKNPKSILQELRDCIEGYENGQIKHFLSIASKDKGAFSLKDEVVTLLETSPNYLIFKTFSKDFFLVLARELSESNYKKIKNCATILLKENREYLDNVVDGLRELLLQNPADKEELFELLDKIDKTLDILMSELLDVGFAKGFLYRLIYGIFINAGPENNQFGALFDHFIQRLQFLENNYKIVFRIDTSEKVKRSIKSTSPNVVIYDNLSHIPNITHTEYPSFKKVNDKRKFIECNIEAPDYLAALKIAKAMLSENLDILNLGFSDEFLKVHTRVLVIDTTSPDKAAFQETKNFLDGKYKVAKDHYQYFIDKLPIILTNQLISPETKEKIKSAIRYLRLGNQSTEVEHKFINYWIGLEYMFSNYDNYNTINRIKTHFVTVHTLAYIKRNFFEFHRNVKKLTKDFGKTLSRYTEDPLDCLLDEHFYLEVIEAFMEDAPLLSYRARNLYEKVVKKNQKGKRLVDKYIEYHQKNLIIHFTRIYRLRNEIIHDAATNTNEQIAANLRYYLTFILNGAIEYLCQPHDDAVAIEDYFIHNEITLGNIEQKGWPLEDLLDMPVSIDFIP